MILIELVGYSSDLSSTKKQDIFITVINNSTADVILFPGSSLDSMDDLKYALPRITNRRSIVIFEVGELKVIQKEKGERKKPSSYSGSVYILDLSTFRNVLPQPFQQIYSTSAELSANRGLMTSFFKQYKDGLRSFVCKGKRFTVLMCGETAMLKCDKVQKHLQKAHFRFESDDAFLSQFTKMEAETDVFLNPIHTIQGEQGVMGKKREQLSAEGKYYFSTAALSGGKNLKAKSLQYACIDSRELMPVANPSVQDNYISRVFEIN